MIPGVVEYGRFHMSDLLADRLDDLGQRLNDAFRRLEGSGSSAVQHREQGERLRRRHGELQARRQGGTGVVDREMKALEDAVDRWVTGVDQRFASGNPRTPTGKS